MSIHLHRELESLRKMVLEEGALVEESLDLAIRAFNERNADLAKAVIKGDERIDNMEIYVEEECLKLLALHTPVAADLRFVVAVLKLNNDLERMGDVAVNLARRARFLAKNQPVDTPAQFVEMGQRTREMVKLALDSLVNRDIETARKVCAMDDAVDAMKRQLRDEVRARIEKHPDWLPIYLKLMDVPRHLERIADLATNVAHDVIYMVTGEIVRHQREAPEEEKS